MEEKEVKLSKKQIDEIEAIMRDDLALTDAEMSHVAAVTAHHKAIRRARDEWFEKVLKRKLQPGDPPFVYDRIAKTVRTE